MILERSIEQIITKLFSGLEVILEFLALFGAHLGSTLVGPIPILCPIIIAGILLLAVIVPEITVCTAEWYINHSLFSGFLRSGIFHDPWTKVG